MTTTQTDGRPLPARIDPAPSQMAIRHELTVEDVLAQVQKIQQVMDAVMKPDVHYGIIPGTSRKDADGKEQAKPSLYKAGAEKLCLVFRLDPEYEPIAKDERPDLITFMVRCVLYHIPTGDRIASGIGSCSSREEKYGFRKAARLCPQCQQPAIIKGKAEYGGGWLCFKKKDGCGAKFPDGASEIESQVTGKVPNENIWDLHNTILKMAEKRALVAAVLNGTAASDFFTQDLEDLAGEGESPPPAGRRPPASEDAERGLEEYEAAQRAQADLLASQRAHAPTVPTPPNTAAEPRASGEQVRAIQTISRKAGLDPHAEAERILGRPCPAKPDGTGGAIPTLTLLSTTEASAVISGIQKAVAAAGGGR